MRYQVQESGIGVGTRCEVSGVGIRHQVSVLRIRNLYHVSV